MQVLFAIYLAFTLWLYFSRDPIRTDVNFVLQRWYVRGTRFFATSWGQWQNRRVRTRYYDDDRDSDRYIDRR